MNIAIKVENLSKAYQLGQIGTGTISRDLERWYARIRGKDDPFIKIGEINDQSIKSSSDIVWSLRNINFEISQGEAVGIIGRNGAGKSTLLKILSKITSPTTGKISGMGRIASLLEVGTGFHPELSGRENIFLNGAILGMRKKEIQRKLDEIVSFAGVERYLETPVKRYSSGMYVRLAFAVAAHLESEILIVDEVLAVGDAEFQKKCLGKMGEVSKGEGRTVLFVSHNMASIKQLCTNVIYMANGEIIERGPADAIVTSYLSKVIQKHTNEFYRDKEINGIVITSLGIVSDNGGEIAYPNIDEDFLFQMEYNVIDDNTVVSFTLGFWNENEEVVFLSMNNSEINYLKPKAKGSYKTVCRIPGCLLNDITYYISLNISGQNFQNPVTLQDVMIVKFEDGIKVRRDYSEGFPGFIRPALNWNTININL